MAIYKEVKIERIATEVMENAKEVLGDKLHKVILYGSYSRGDFDEYSDVDIMVLAEIDDDELYQYRKNINRVSSRISLDNDITVSVILRDKDDFFDKIDVLPLYQNILNEGIEIDVQ